LYFADNDPERPICYELDIDLIGGVPAVVKERLAQRRTHQKTKGRPYCFLKLAKGRGRVWTGSSSHDGDDTKDHEQVVLADPTQLGIASLGNLDKHPRIVRVRSYIEQWYLSYFVPDAARTQPVAGAQRFLDRRGSNVGNVLQYYERQYPKQFKQILNQVAAAIPGLKKITTKISDDKRLLLSFDEAGYKDPFYQQSMSDGTLKMLAYAVLLADPEPRPFIGIEEPENGLYVQLIEQLASQLNAHAEAERTQILVTTHSTYFVDALTPEQVWLVEKSRTGATQIRRTADLPNIKELTSEGLPLGSLWYSRHFDQDVG